MKYIKAILLILLGASLALAPIVGILIYEGKVAPPSFTVEVVNDSDTTITQVRIEHERGLVHHNRLGVGKRVSLPVYTSGEGSYRISVTLAGGKVLDGSGRYIERGYSVKERITNSEIKSEYDELY